MSGEVSVIATSTLGDRSYLASDGEIAVVVDPQRDIDRVLALAGRSGVRISHVAETHIHNDYLSGGLHLARLTGAHYLVAEADRVAFSRTPVRDGDVIEVSDRLRLWVLATPGHTFNHLSYVLDQREPGGDWRTVGVFTGGSVLFGTTARTDLLGKRYANELAHAQHASARRLAELLPDGAQVWPTHGFGSFCAAGQASQDSGSASSTISQEKANNPVFRLAADEFARQTLAGLDEYPAYYAHMGVSNLAGPELVDLTPAHRADPADLQDRLAAGEWLVDLRHRTAYMSRHLAGTVSLGLDGQMSTWLGWLIDWGTPVTLLGETPEQIAEAQRELVRIGIDRPAAAATGQPAEWAADPSQLRVIPTADFIALAGYQSGEPEPDLPPPDVVLDVRADSEWRESHIAGAVHVPLYELPRRLGDVPGGALWVHCTSGYRASVAASLLANAGRRVVLLDDDIGQTGKLGIPMVTTG